MKSFIIHTDISPTIADPESWILGIPKMLKEKAVKDVRYKTAYCCAPERKVIAEFEGPDKDAVSKALKQIGLSFTTIMEVKVLKESSIKTDDEFEAPYHTHM